MNFNSVREKFPDCFEKEKIFLNQTTLEIQKKDLINLLTHLKNENGFKVLMDLTAVDYVEPRKGTKIVYWLHNPDSLERIRIKVFLERDETIPTVIHLWRGAKWYEREIYDLFGVKFDEHHDLKRLLMPDNWVGHPLRKDYNLTEESVEFKHGVKPKVPSKIIHVESKQKLLPP